jgi:hypothetical protein
MSRHPSHSGGGDPRPPFMNSGLVTIKTPMLT